MKNTLVKICVTIVMMVVGICCYAQSGQMTSYERQRYELANTAVKKITEPLTSEQKVLIALVYTKMKKEVRDIFDETVVMENIIFHYCGTDGELRTPMHLLPRYSYPEAGVIGNYRKVWKNVWSWYYQERRELDNKATPEDKRRETERVENKTGRDELVNSLADVYTAWAMHAPGESETAYTARLDKDAVRVFDSLAFIVCDAQWKGCAASLIKDSYDEAKKMQGFSLDCWNNGHRQSMPGYCVASRDEFSRARMSNVDIKDCFAEGIMFMNGCWVPTAMRFRLKGRTDEYLVRFSEGRELCIRAEDIPLDGTDNFRNNISRRLSGHIFNYTEYAEGRVTKSELYKNLVAIWNVFSILANTSLDVHFGDFLPDCTTLSVNDAERVTDEFCAYCKENYTRWVYGRYYMLASRRLQLDTTVKTINVFDKADVAHTVAVINEMMGSFLRREAEADAPINALCLIYGLNESPGLLNAEKMAAVFVNANNILATGYRNYLKTLRKNGRHSATPCIDYLRETFKNLISL